MSALNLMPWRERRRQSALRRWCWGTALTLSLSTCLVALVDHQLQSWQQQHARQQQQWLEQDVQLKTRLADAPLWQGRQRQAQQLKTQGLHWQQQQQQAWRALSQILALPPQGVQMTHLTWQDQQVRIRGWAVSAAHVQAWQDALQLQRVEWHPAQWRHAEGLAMRQHAFVLEGRLQALGTGS